MFLQWFLKYFSILHSYARKILNLIKQMRLYTLRTTTFLFSKKTDTPPCSCGCKKQPKEVRIYGLVKYHPVFDTDENYYEHPHHYPQVMKSNTRRDASISNFEFVW